MAPAVRKSVKQSAFIAQVFENATQKRFGVRQRNQCANK
jgi:hypothetical protein